MLEEDPDRDMTEASVASSGRDAYRANDSEKEASVSLSGGRRPPQRLVLDPWPRMLVSTTSRSAAATVGTDCGNVPRP